MRLRFQFGIKWCVCVNRLSMANQMRHWRPVGSVRPMRPLILIALRTLHTISSRGNSLSGRRQAAGVIRCDMSLEASLVFVAQFSTTFLLSLSLSFPSSLQSAQWPHQCNCLRSHGRHCGRLHQAHARDEGNVVAIERRVRALLRAHAADHKTWRCG